MQVVPDEIRKCVAFISFEHRDGNERLAGTGFFVSSPVDGTDQIASYLVTAKHVIAAVKQHSKDDAVHIRLNTKDGASKAATSWVTQWKEHPTDSSADVVVLPWAPDPKEFDYLNVPTSIAVTDTIIKKYGIGAGDEVFLTGLFSNHWGQTKNLPIIRTGNIALMAGEKIETTKLGPIDAYLVEVRSIGGLSGSPVFVYLGHLRSIDGSIAVGGEKELFVWLGVMQGHWEIDESVIEENTPKQPKNVNMGIGIVVAATKVLELINTHPDLEKDREEVQQREKTS